MKRKGSGRKKGQVTKVKGRELGVEQIKQEASTGTIRPDVRMFYDAARTLKVILLKEENSGQALSDNLEWYLENYGDNSTEVFRILNPLLNAFRLNDADFFKELHKTFETMVQNDASPQTMPSPPHDPVLFRLIELSEWFKGPSISMWKKNAIFPPSMVEVMSLSAKDREPLFLTQIQDYIFHRTGKTISLSTASAKARTVGLPVHGKYGHKK